MQTAARARRLPRAPPGEREDRRRGRRRSATSSSALLPGGAALLPARPADRPLGRGADRRARFARRRFGSTREEVPARDLGRGRGDGGEGRPRGALRRDRVAEADPRRQGRLDGARRSARGRARRSRRCSAARSSSSSRSRCGRAGAGTRRCSSVSAFDRGGRARRAQAGRRGAHARDRPGGDRRHDRRDRGAADRRRPRRVLTVPLDLLDLPAHAGGDACRSTGASPTSSAASRCCSFGVAGFLVGSMLCAVAWSMVALIVFRGVQGLAAGAILPTTTTIIGDLYEPAERGPDPGLHLVGVGRRGDRRPALGGFFAEYWTWRGHLLAQSPARRRRRVAHPPPPARAVERRAIGSTTAGAVTLTAACSLLILALLEGGVSWAWGSTAEHRALRRLRRAARRLRVIERTVAEPILPLWVFRHRMLVAGESRRTCDRRDPDRPVVLRADLRAARRRRRRRRGRPRDGER